MKKTFLCRLTALLLAAALMLTFVGCGDKTDNPSDVSSVSSGKEIDKNSADKDKTTSDASSDTVSDTSSADNSYTDNSYSNNYTDGSQSTSDISSDKGGSDYQIFGSLGTEQSSQPGLYVEDGVVKLGGKVFYGIGTNYYDAYLRQLLNPLDGDIEEGLKTIASYNLPYIRARFSPWGDEGMEYFWTDREEYYRSTDRFVALCEKYNIGIIATLVWTTNAYTSEGQEFAEFIEDPYSDGYQKMLVYMKSIITRYKNSPAIWGWEVGNEYNLGCDVQDTTLTADALSKHYSIITPLIRAWDGTNRIISTGNSQNRGASWHLWQEGNWTVDTLEQLKIVTKLWTTPEISVNSIHVYNRTQALDGKTGVSVSDYLAAEVALSKELGTPLFIGEYCDDEIGKAETENDTEENSLAKFDVLHEAIVNNDIQLACLWIYGRGKDDYINPSEYNKHMLAAAQKANKNYVAQGKQNTSSYWSSMTAVVK